MPFSNDLVDQWLGISKGRLKNQADTRSLQTVGEIEGLPSVPDVEAKREALKQAFQQKLKQNQMDILGGRTAVGTDASVIPEPPKEPAFVNPRETFQSKTGLNPGMTLAENETAAKSRYYAGSGRQTGEDFDSWKKKQEFKDDLRDENWTNQNKEIWGRLAQSNQNTANRMELADDIRMKRDVVSMRTQMRNDPVLKELNKQDIGMDQVKQLVESARSGNTLATAALGIKIAKGYGEVGVLTESDVNRYIASGKLSQRAADVLMKWATGTPTDATMQEIMENVAILEDLNRTKVQSLSNGYVEALSRNYGIEPEDAAYRLGVDYTPGGQARGGGSVTEDDEALTWARQNPNDPRAVEIMRVHGGKR